MAFETDVDEGVSRRPMSWPSTGWAAPLMALAMLLLVAAPARVWLGAATRSMGDGTVPGRLLGLWVFLGLAPAAVGTVAWLTLRSRPGRQRFVLAATWASAVGLLTMLPITPYVFAF